MQMPLVSKFLWTPTNSAQISHLWPSCPQLPFTRLRLSPDVAKAMKIIYTPTLALDFQRTMQWTNATTTSLVNNLFGSPTAMQKFIHSYDGANHAILCLQMRLMGWDVDIVHRNDHYIMDTDYWSCLGADLCFYSLFKTYLDITRMLRIENPPPTLLPMK